VETVEPTSERQRDRDTGPKAIGASPVLVFRRMARSAPVRER
jgi:hypothetical protein